MAGDPYRPTGGSKGHSTRHRETANDAYQLGVELRWRQDQGKPALLRHAVLHAAARPIATVTALCRRAPPHTAEELTGKKRRLFPGAGVGTCGPLLRGGVEMIGIATAWATRRSLWRKHCPHHQTF